MFSSFFVNRRRLVIAYGGAAALFVLLYLQVQTAARFAEVMNTIGNLMQSHGMSSPAQFAVALREFISIAVLFAALQPLITLASRAYDLCWRDVLTERYLRGWPHITTELPGVSQRIQECVEYFAPTMLVICMPLARSVMVLITFLPMLWVLSTRFNFHYICTKPVPGMLIWISLVISVVAVVISYFVGIKQKKLDYKIQVKRAEYRSALEYAEGNRYARKPSQLGQLWREYRYGTMVIYVYLFFYEVWQCSYGQLWAVLPLAYLGENVITGVASYGDMAQTIAALGEVIGALSVFCNLWTTLTKFSSVVQRLRELEGSLVPSVPLQDSGRIPLVIS